MANASVSVRIPGPAGSDHPRVTLVAANLSLTLPLTRPVTDHHNLAADWVQISRPGQRPLLRNAGGKLRTMTIEVLFKNLEQGGGPVERDLRTLAKLSAAEAPIRVAYGPLEAGLWRLSGIDINAMKRAVKTNHIKLAEARLEFVEAAEDSPKPAAARKPAPDAAPPPAGAAGGQAKPAPKRTYTVRSGDTLSRIALRECGNANHWPKIAEANKLRNPNRIYPGQKLTIPC